MIFLLLAALFLGVGLYSALKVQRYTVVSGRITRPVRIAVLADLHASRCGSGQRTLIDAVDAQKPDLVVIPGDFFDDFTSDENAEAALRGLAGRYPCYYTTGNHECWTGDEFFMRKMALLEKYGVKRLRGAPETILVGNCRLNVAGVDDPDASRICCVDGGYDGFDAQLDRARPENGLFTLLISHRPEAFSRYAARGFDLVLCGHAHGGQWRIPGLLNGVYAPNQGLFPKYAGGLYRAGSTVMIVSRGLTRLSEGVPRFYNRPELVVVDLVPEQNP